MLVMYRFPMTFYTAKHAAVKDSGVSYLVDCFKQKPLLGVDRLGFRVSDTEELGIEEAQVPIDQVGMHDIASTMTGGIRVVEALRAESAVGDLAPNITRLT